MVIIRIQNFDYQVAKVTTALVLTGTWPRQVFKVSKLNQVVNVALAIGQSVHVELMRSGLRREEINTDDMRMDGQWSRCPQWAWCPLVELMRSGLRRGEEINTDDMRMDGVCASVARLSGHHHYLQQLLHTLLLAATTDIITHTLGSWPTHHSQFISTTICYYYCNYYFCYYY